MNVNNTSILPKTRKTRIVCISDTHSANPADGGFKLPKGDVLIHAGDLTNQGSYSELRRTVDWLVKADFEAKIVVAGNHDITLDSAYYATHGHSFHNQHPQDAGACQSLLHSAPGLTYLVHQSATIYLSSPTGPHTRFSVLGSPYVPRPFVHPTSEHNATAPGSGSGSGSGLDKAKGSRSTWAFAYAPEDAPALWSSIPLNTDIVITHTPSYSHLDSSPQWGRAGCEDLRRALWRVRPRLHVCGHVHERRGVERVRWRIGLPWLGGLEEGASVWADGGGRGKESLVDLTGGWEGALENDGALVDEGGEGDGGSGNAGGVGDGFGQVDRSVIAQEAETEVRRHRGTLPHPKSASTIASSPPTTRVRPPHAHASSTSAKPSFESIASTPSFSSSISEPSLDTFPSRSSCATTSSTFSQQCIDPIFCSPSPHTAALEGRLGRKETCFVNAAIMARSWGKGPKRFNRPIVVELDLPVWEEEEEDVDDLEDEQGFSEGSAKELEDAGEYGSGYTYE